MAGEIPFNPQNLRWAREWRQRSQEEAAHKVGKRPEDIEAWETGQATPTIKQARTLAEYYGRPFLEFFWHDEPPVQMPELVPDFRLNTHAPDQRQHWELISIQAWAEEQRLNALDLMELLGDEPLHFPVELVASLDDGAEEIAATARLALNFPIEEQIGLRSAERPKLPSILRAKMEARGVLTLKRNRLQKLGARGLCVATFPLPIIVYGNEAASGQAFTLAHELAHIMLRQSAITGAPSAGDNSSPKSRIEAWCNRFAAAFLVPPDALRAVVDLPTGVLDRIDDNDLRSIANCFGVSRHAMLIRLVHLGFVRAGYYWEIKRPQFISEEENYKGFGRGEYYGSRYRASRGDFYTALVLEAWGAGRITNHNAAEFMGIRNLEHLNDIRDRFETV